MVKIAVLSDLHPVFESDDEDSFFVIDKPSNPSTSPIAGIFSLIKESNVKADILVCAGDIGNRGCPSKFKHGWEFVNQLKVEIGASELIAVPGNHDHDSRNIYHRFSRTHGMQMSEPPFPSNDDLENTSFWAWHWATREVGNIAFHMVNSSAYHGVGSEEKHGRIADSTIERLMDSVRSSGNVPRTNIVVCHHHPNRIDTIGYPDYEAMENGAALLEEIDKAESDEWLIIHGHLHFPRLRYASSSGNGRPVVFSAGSFSGPLDNLYHEGIANQFYLLELEDPSEETPSIRGKFQSWDWYPRLGWIPARSDNGLPANGGFGFRGDEMDLAESIVSLLESQPEVAGEIIYRQIPDLSYVTPKDLHNMKKRLMQRSGVDLNIENGRVESAGRSF